MCEWNKGKGLSTFALLCFLIKKLIRRVKSQKVTFFLIFFIQALFSMIVNLVN